MKGLKAILLFSTSPPSFSSSNASTSSTSTSHASDPLGSMKKDTYGSAAFHPKAPMYTALKRITQRFPHLLVGVDVCLCTYTSHGHCHVPHPQRKIDVDTTAQLLARLAISYIEAGAQLIAPSDMTDTRILLIKAHLLQAGFGHVPVMAYSAKFHSSLYGPFRDSVNSSLPVTQSRKGYQLPMGSKKLALRALTRDAHEGADILMIKPGWTNLDIVKLAADTFPQLPIAMYQVSGEYAMLVHASQAGAFSLKEAVLESLTSGIRAGAQILVTYFTPQVLDWLLVLNHDLTNAGGGGVKDMEW
ncbi:hypothetical protein HMI54_007546 [Coelomomyces lativittatus]|nr:hypothetical protein HMI56_007357 [Coelomomyces lativittatus]KAJ1516973.1 hypothetical protein HMI54_007546 [Coelomomyces lativittatus]